MHGDLHLFRVLGTMNVLQNGGWAFSMIPAIKKLYKSKEDRKAALKRHWEFFNTHPYMVPPYLRRHTSALEKDARDVAQR
ncbi:PTS system, mannose-specific IID component [Bacillus thuringiensis serovar israelensis ATCC 35646]|nr:PTS system, mannose-specific IID component [Bacillus thuringiensis serovar israelensis ATCC 35646]